MPQQPYDPVGALNGLFAPAYIVGNPESEAAVAQWNAKNAATPPPAAPAADNPAAVAATSAPGVPPAASGRGTPEQWAAMVANYNAQGGANGTYRVPSPLATGAVAPTPTPAPAAAAPARDRIALAMMNRGG